jgi:hypothetical protein
LTSNRFPAPSFTAFSAAVLRIVESQEQVATTKIVSDLTEQYLLEQMLEDSKPDVIDPGLHYLLSTPFRYPPLRHGSRFGSRLEPSLFYASLDFQTCLHECAYYRFLFWHDMVSPPPAPIRTQHTVFCVEFQSELCVDLRSVEYDDIRSSLTSPVSYEVSQALGATLRDAGADLIIFESARCTGDNVAAFSRRVFSSGPKDQEQWNSELTGNRVLFSGSRGLFRYQSTAFSGEDGRLLRVPETAY